MQRRLTATLQTAAPAGLFLLCECLLIQCVTFDLIGRYCSSSSSSSVTPAGFYFQVNSGLLL